MPASKNAIPAGIKPKNKLRRQAAYLSIKKAKESEKRDLRFRRKREEEKDESLREDRLAKNVPATIDAKRVWDAGVGDESDMLGWAVDLERMAKRRKLEEEQAQEDGEDGEEGMLAKLKKRDAEQEAPDEEYEEQDELDSMLNSASEAEDDNEDGPDNVQSRSQRKPDPPKRASSPTTSTATNMTVSPEYLKEKFPTIFNPPAEAPNILITTSLNSTLHNHARILEGFFPNSTYIRRTAHAHAHKFSIREIAEFAHNRGYGALVILSQALHKKEPDGLEIIHLPIGPHFHFSVNNWVEGRKLPGHAKDTGHIPELVLNNFRTPLGLLTAHFFTSLFPTKPELVGRTVLTLHNQRDYIFVRRHRYAFREKRSTEKSVVGTDGKVVKGAEDLKVGLQEIGPRFTLKLRRIDRGVQWKSGKEWEWKAGMEKQRTRFNM